MDRQCGYVFGYGSLVDIDQLARFVGREIKSHEWTICRLRGYRRLWNIAMDNIVDLPGYKYYIDAKTRVRPRIFVTFLNIQPCENRAINGIAFRISAEELHMLDIRERNYDRIGVDGMLDRELPAPCWVYVGTDEAERRYQEGLRNNNACIDRNYYEAVEAAFATHGSAFLAEFHGSTDGVPVPMRDLRVVPLPSK